MNLLIYWCNFSVTISGIISFLAAVTSNFTWNRYWTYPDSRSKHFFRQYGEFLLINALGLALRVPILAYVDPLMRALFNNLPFRLPFITPNAMGDNFTLALAVLIVMFWNFFRQPLLDIF
jgi:putative flippase GtrA